MERKKTDNEWMRRYADGLYTTEEVARLSGSVKRPGGKERWESVMADVWDEAALTGSASTRSEQEQYKAEARRLLQRLGHRSRRRTWTRRIAMMVAATAAFACIAVVLVNQWHHITPAQVSYLEASTTYGECRQVRLPDGTRLTLNARSTLRYPERFAGGERRVELAGEAFFQVAHDAQRPFIVATPRLSVRVLGTQFNAKAYREDEYATVDVEEGKVQVELPEATMRLRAHEQIRVNTRSGEYSKHCGQREEVAVWRKGSLRFHRTPIHDVAKESPPKK